MKKNRIYEMCLVLFLLLLLLYFSCFQKEYFDVPNTNKESFPFISTSSDGSSSRYGWGHDVSRTCPSCETTYSDNADTCPVCEEGSRINSDDYILKSAVPPCPDMSQYILKSDIPPCPDMTKYILKSDIPPCPNVDLSEYIKKTDIPTRKQLDCPKCPMTLLCPKCDTEKITVKTKKNKKPFWDPQMKKTHWKPFWNPVLGSFLD